MANCKDILKYALRKLEESYCDFGNDKDMQYTFGYFDAVAVIRELSESPLPDRELRKE